MRMMIVCNLILVLVNLVVAFCFKSLLPLGTAGACLFAAFLLSKQKIVS